MHIANLQRHVGFINDIYTNGWYLFTKDELKAMDLWDYACESILDQDKIYWNKLRNYSDRLHNEAMAIDGMNAR